MPKKSIDLSELKKQYDSIKDIAERFKKELSDELTKIADINGLKLGFPIQKRIKSWGSIKDKIINQKLKLNSIEQLQDLIGLRCVFLYKRDIKLIERIVKDTFVIKKQCDTFDRLAENQFGYSSLHFVVQLPKEWLNVPSLSEFANFLAEIQIRTISQHIWAEVSHELQYKSKIDVPDNLIRPIYRASALLETVDLEFDRLLIEREKYKKKITSQADQGLNVDNIERMLDDLLPAENKDFFEEYAALNNELNNSGILTTSQLRKFIKDNLERLIEYDKNRVKSELEDYNNNGFLDISEDEWERVKKGYFYTHTGLIRNILNRAL